MTDLGPQGQGGFSYRKCKKALHGPPGHKRTQAITQDQVHDKLSRRLDSESSKVVFNLGGPKSSILETPGCGSCEVFRKLMNDRIKEILYENEAYKFKL